MLNKKAALNVVILKFIIPPQLKCNYIVVVINDLSSLLLVLKKHILMPSIIESRYNPPSAIQYT